MLISLYHTLHLVSLVGVVEPVDICTVVDGAVGTEVHEVGCQVVLRIHHLQSGDCYY